MKIIKQTSGEMIVKDSSVMGILGGLIFVVIGGVVGYFVLTGHESSWVGGIFGAVFVIAGLSAIFSSSSIEVTIDKNTGRIRYSRKSLKGAKAAEYNLSDAVALEFRRSYRMETSNRGSSRNGVSLGTTRQVMSHQSIIMMKDGTEIPLGNIKDENQNIFGYWAARY